MTSIVVLHDVDVYHACLDVGPSLLRLQLVDKLHTLGCELAVILSLILILLLLAFCMLIIVYRLVKALMLV